MAVRENDSAAKGKVPPAVAPLILEGLPMGLLFCDREGIIRYVNSAYANLVGRQVDELVGRPITEIIPHSRASVVMAHGEPELGELCQLGPGHSSPVIVNRLPVKGDDGLVAGMISQAIFNDPEELRSLSAKIEQLGRKLSHYKRRFEASHAPQHTFDSILGENECLLRLKRQAQSYARLDEPVLILGETGSGKELFAHALHAASPRAQGPLVCINCAAIPKELFESELFGYARGAFSGARQEGKMGQMELADKGTLFLDEIGELPPEIQAKLLRALESGEVRRVGGISPKRVDFRLIAATNRNISAMLAKGDFREDLYYRINTFILEIPPLRERREDILPIARYILARMELDAVQFAPETESAMREFSWPGNVRQLHNAVVHAVTMRQGNIIQPEDFPPETLPGKMGKINQNQLSSMMAEKEARALRGALADNGCNVAATARALGIARATLYEKMRKYGINPRQLGLAGHDSPGQT